MAQFNFKTDVLLEALKELGRVALFAIIPILIVQLESGKFDWRIVGIAGAIAVLKALDRGLHLWGKEAGNTAELGLSRF